MNSDESKNFKDNDLVYVKYRISIRDNGIGINDEDLNKLFLDFGKLDDTGHRNR